MRRSRAVMQATAILSSIRSLPSSMTTLIIPSLSSSVLCSRSGRMSTATVPSALVSSYTLPSVPQQRTFSTAGTTGIATGATREARMKSLLMEKLQAQVVDIKDVSGGCGDFYQILVVSSQFQGVTRIHTHRMVNEVLEKYIGKMHGLTLRTLTPEQYATATAKK